MKLGISSADGKSCALRRVLVRLACGLALLAGPCAAAWGQTSGPAPQGRQWAVLIGIEKYQKVNPLRYTANDVRILAETLRVRGGYPPECVLEITDQSADPALQPTKAVLMEKLSQWLKKPGPKDQILVYFSGHGLRDARQKMYLVPIDCDPAKPADTAIPVTWLRQQIAACQADSKLLILDACHAGSEKGEDTAGDVAAETLGTAFKGLEKVVTLASSTADQKSQIWDDKKQSLFSYWLNQGLRGSADKDGDGNVDIDELYEYTNRAVSHTAETVCNRPQTPVRIVGSGVQGVPVVVRLRPLGLRQLLDDMAEQISDDLLERRINRVGVLEFGNDAKLAELVLGANFGLLGRYCAEEVERRLVDRGAGKFTVVERRQLQAALKAEKFALKDIESPQAMAKLGKAAHGMTVVALGTLRNRSGRVVTLQCKLIQTGEEGLAGATGGIAWLNESEWAMLGSSVIVKPEDRVLQPPTGEGPPVPVATQVVQRMDEHAQGPHPLQDPNCPFRMKIMIGGQERTPVFRGNDMLVPVRIGEVYQVWVKNDTSQTVRMRLLVDGLNTLPERERTKGVSTWLVASRVNLDEARAWFVDPGKWYAVPGFVSQTGEKGQLNEFKVVDIAQSVAARQQFTDQVGIITAAFYDPPGEGESRGVGTGLGQRRDVRMDERDEQAVGKLRAVIHIRYVDADALAAEPQKK
jgi:hypothetical protein